MSDISKTADRALAVLVELSDGEPATPQRLAARTGLNRTVVQRLLTTLVARGFVTRDTGTYMLSPRVRRLSEGVQPGLRRVVRPLDAALSRRTSETVVFQVVDGDQVVVLDESVPRRPDAALQVRHQVGSRSPLERSASGLAILASWSSVDRARALRGRPADVVDATETRITAIQQDGLARTSDELQVGVSGLAVAVVGDTGVVGSVAVLAPTNRLAVLEGHAADLIRTARRMEDALTDV